MWVVVLLPLWLLAVAVVGFRQYYVCANDRLEAAAVANRERPSEEALAVCRGPSWKAPIRGLTWPPGATEGEWAFVSLSWAGTVAFVVVRVTRRRASCQPASTFG